MERSINITHPGDTELYGTLEVCRTRDILDNMLAKQHKYTRAELEDAATSFHAATICEAIDQDILAELLLKGTNDRRRTTE